jgi:hypothetical protein
VCIPSLLFSRVNSYCIILWSCPFFSSKVTPFLWQVRHTQIYLLNIYLWKFNNNWRLTWKVLTTHINLKEWWMVFNIQYDEEVLNDINIPSSGGTYCFALSVRSSQKFVCANHSTFSKGIPTIFTIRTFAYHYGILTGLCLKELLSSLKMWYNVIKRQKPPLYTKLLHLVFYCVNLCWWHIASTWYISQSMEECGKNMFFCVKNDL